MLDPCSTGSYISEAAASELELKGHAFDLTIAGTGGTEIHKRSRRVSLSVSSPDKRFSSKLHANVLDNIASDTPAFPWSQMKANWPHLRSVPFGAVSKRPCIDVMIGSDHPSFHFVLDEIHGNDPHDPIARLTNLGWVCFGPALVNTDFRQRSRCNFARTYRTSQAATQSSLDDTLRRFWELESIGIKDVKQEMTMEEKNAVAKVADTISFCDGRYSLGVPWKEGEPRMKNNYEAALVRLQSQEKSLKKRGPDIMDSYSNIFKEYERKGYIKKVEKSESERQWFLPHFPVVRPEKNTTKVRAVFDAAMKYEGKSLNDAIYAGPKLQREVVDVLTRFRRAPVALMTDISEMFLQVGLHEPDRPYHRFLWREFDTSRDPGVYEFQRLVFGNTASPFCAQYVLHSHAQKNKSAFPEAAESVDNSMYVDDLLDSNETVESTKALQNQMSDLLGAAGFNLRKWASNEPAVLENVSPTDRLPTVEISDGESPKTKTLGVLWEARRDVFIFQLKTPEPGMTPTKRSVLSAIATLYDPLQFLSPFLIRAKILMQEIWTEGLNWDDSLPEHLKVKWDVWTCELSDLSEVSIPRCLRLPDPETVELHLFSDASKVAYASVAYLVCRYENSPPTSRIVASKSRVAPLKAVTIPRLELLGAVLSSRLSVSILRVLAVDRTIFWTDSENVYYWAQNQSRLYKPFVANRVAEVQRTSNPEQWHHVPGEKNPADAATRGLSASELSKSSFWMEGPSFLKSEECNWPASPSRDAANVDPERRSSTKTFATRVGETELIAAADYSSLRRLYQVTGWIQRFLRTCRQRGNLERNLDKTLSSFEIAKAEEFWVKRCQSEAFPNGVKESCLTRLSPTEDANGLLRINGRLSKAESIPYDAKFPILLPKKHTLTKLIVQNTHESLGHRTGVEHALTQLRTRFWVIKGRRIVRDIVSSCKECRRRFRVQTAGQVMAPLPKERLYSLRAFDKVGIDFAGPFLTKQGRGKSRAKRYLCLFTCLATRAVHLEMAYFLDTDSFVNAFTRMTSRRGTPSYVITDNGTNFVGAEREIRELVQGLEQDKVIEKTGKYHPIEWKFNPPSAPHFGGVFEAMIKSAKKAIKAILGNAEINDEELHTAICGAEKLLNSRPITYVSSDPDDLTPLTPSHFLVGEVGGTFAPEAIDKVEAHNPVKRWHRIQRLLQHFWKRWQREFLPRLNLRQKWFHPRHNIGVGDVVLVAEPQSSRGEWPLARITEVFPDEDGRVRVVKLCSKGKEYKRPVHRLCPLEYVERKDDD